MRVLFANGRRLPPLGIGGDTVTLETILNYLTELGWDCFALGTLNRPEYMCYEENPEKKLKELGCSFQKSPGLPYLPLWCKIIPSYFLAKELSFQKSYPSLLVREEYLKKTLGKKIEEFKPDLILTQLERSLDVIKSAQKRGLPVVLFIFDLQPENKMLFKKLSSWKHLSIIFISKYIKDKYHSLIKCPYKVIYQPIDRKKYLVKISNRNPRYITMINPVKEKGAAIVFKIIKKMPDKKFLLVEGWKRFADLDYDFTRFKNVTLMTRQNDVCKVYKKTKILLVPSSWEEGFGRVVVEAGISGIPSIASNRGGLKEAVGLSGICIDKYLNVGEWIKAIEKLEGDKNLYDKLSQRAKKQANKFSTEIIGKRILKFFKSIIK